MLHRIFLVRTRPELGDQAQRHWRERHAGVFAGTPGLRGYVQDRPLLEDVERLPYQACSETWFEDAAAEREGYASDHYRREVVPDEEAFLLRDSVWRGRVESEETGAGGRPGAYRVLAFGGTRVPGAGAVDVLSIDRDPPAGGPRQVLSAWAGDPAEARALARAADGLAFAVEPIAVIAPPGWGD